MLKYVSVFHMNTHMLEIKFSMKLDCQSVFHK